VTVLFADVVHSMRIAAAVGAERLREIMAELATRCAAVVQQFGGTVDKFTGDGIMAVFGAPVALEDHALRACLAALGIQEQAGAQAVDVEHRDGVELRVRVGLNSGQVIAGEIGSGALGYTTVGEQVGIAQRMESVAPPGGGMLSASTVRLVDGAVLLGVPELLRIKGAAVDDLDEQAARDYVRAQIPDADPDDLLFFDDLLGIADPDIPLPAIDSDARRRRMAALVNAASLARETAACYVIEDAHWIDEVSESMLADFLTVIPQTRSVVLVTYRPEYQGALTRVPATAAT
jgi:class 3 adenylate cyclase